MSTKSTVGQRVGAPASAPPRRRRGARRSAPAATRARRATARRAAPAESAAVAAGARADSDNYVAEITRDGAYKAGAEGTVEVVLTPKGGYHTNAQYPYKFKARRDPRRRA